MTLKIKLLHPNARIPEYKTAGASGMDLYFCLGHTIVICPGETIRVPTGVAIEVPHGFEAQVRPRSSLSAEGLACHFGTIDSDYRGEIKAVMTNIGELTKAIHPGDRIAQLVIAPVARVEVVQVDELSETVRGAGGFGSTGR